MTNEELEKEVKRLEEQIKDLKVKLKEKAEPIPYRPYEVEVPEDIEDYYTINRVGCIQKLNNVSKSKFILENIYQRGLAFKTREEAEQFDKERILIKKLKDWAKEQQGDWTPNWKDFDEEKNSVICDNEYENFETIKNYYCQEIIKLPYFKSEGIAEQFIKEFGDEIKEVLY